MELRLSGTDPPISWWVLFNLIRQYNECVHAKVEADDVAKNLTYFMLCADYPTYILPFVHHGSNDSTGVEP